MALILSSYVAATRIGGSVQQLVLAGAGLEPVLVPTSVYGRTPARGGRAAPISPEDFRRTLADAEGEGAFAAARVAISGHFSHPDQVAAAAEALDRLPPETIRIVDPVLGDAPKGLYVPEAVAEAVAALLVPRAHWITPNLFELGVLAGRELGAASDAVDAARALHVSTVITSAPAEPGFTGLLVVEPGTTVRISHPRRDVAPNGVGDLITAAFGAALAGGLDARAAALAAVRFVAAAIDAAGPTPGADFPLAALMAFNRGAETSEIDVRIDRP